MTEIRYDVSDGVALITLDAPERRNALSVEMARELIDAARTAEADDAVGAVVVTAEQHFCAGAVRSVLADTGRDPVEDEAYRNLETVYAAFTTIGGIGVPTIAAVRGAAVGAGLNLALATDLRIVSRTARLLPGFAQIGIHPGRRALHARSTASPGVRPPPPSGSSVTRSTASARSRWDSPGRHTTTATCRTRRSRSAAGREGPRPRPTDGARASAARPRPGGMPWDVAVELERSPQMWSLRRKHGG